MEVNCQGVVRRKCENTDEPVETGGRITKRTGSAGRSVEAFLRTDTTAPGIWTAPNPSVLSDIRNLVNPTLPPWEQGAEDGTKSERPSVTDGIGIVYRAERRLTCSWLRIAGKEAKL